MHFLHYFTLFCLIIVSVFFRMFLRVNGSVYPLFPSPLPRSQQRTQITVYGHTQLRVARRVYFVHYFPHSIQCVVCVRAGVVVFAQFFQDGGGSEKKRRFFKSFNDMKSFKRLVFSKKNDLSRFYKSFNKSFKRLEFGRLS